MGNHPVMLGYSSLKKGVEDPQKNDVAMANYQVIQQKISKSQMKIIPMEVQPTIETITSHLGHYSVLEPYLHAWQFYTLREKNKLKMTHQNTKFSILLVQSFRSDEHLILISNFILNVILKVRIKLVNSCVYSNLYNSCKLSVVNVNVLNNDLMLFLKNYYFKKSHILFMHFYVYTYICIKYIINQHMNLYLKMIYKHNFTPHIIILQYLFYFIKTFFKELLSVCQFFCITI